ncbi:MAG: hypothetical protein IPM29_25505 [Planctomycetes bacterium]|nr:hypothetical protein [Planctomycetota bacterium]
MRALRIFLLATVAVAVSLLPRAPGDAGRSGGIVVLPCALPSAESGQTLRFAARYAFGAPVIAKLPPTLADGVVVIYRENGGDVTTGRVSGDEFVVSAEELQELREAGVAFLGARVFGADTLVIDLHLLISPTGDPTVLEVW